jgi:uncharacterized membrane-anchored protein
LFTITSVVPTLVESDATHTGLLDTLMQARSGGSVVYLLPW